MPTDVAHRGLGLRAAAAAVAVVAVLSAHVTGQPRLADESDRAAFRAWFLVLADAQFDRPTPDVTDCSGLVRHAVREALRPHSPDWLRRFLVPGMPRYPDVRRRPLPQGDTLPLFRVSEAGAYAEFADARTIVRYNARTLGRSASAAHPGDLFYFHQDAGRAPDHLMIYLGPSVFDRSADDWVVYHTGPDGARSGEMRKVRLRDLLRHPVARWRPDSSNPAFVGVFRLTLL